MPFESSLLGGMRLCSARHLREVYKVLRHVVHEAAVFVPSAFRGTPPWFDNRPGIVRPKERLREYLRAIAFGMKQEMVPHISNARSLKRGHPRNRTRLMPNSVSHPAGVHVESLGVIFGLKEPGFGPWWESQVKDPFADVLHLDGVLLHMLGRKLRELTNCEVHELKTLANLICDFNVERDRAFLEDVNQPSEGFLRFDATER